MKMSNRKRRGRRERAHMKYMMKCREHERKVAEKTRRERTAAHREHLVLKVEKLERSRSRVENRAVSPRPGLLRRLLGRRA